MKNIIYFLAIQFVFINNTYGMSQETSEYQDSSNVTNKNSQINTSKIDNDTYRPLLMAAKKRLKSLYGNSDDTKVLSLEKKNNK